MWRSRKSGDSHVVSSRSADGTSPCALGDTRLRGGRFTAEVEKLQAEYERMQKVKEDAQKAVKDSGLGLMKSVLKSAQRFACCRG